MNKKLVLIGGGGFAFEVLEIAELLGYEVIGYFANERGSLEIEYLGKTENILNVKHLFDVAFIAFGAVNLKSLLSRMQVANFLIQSEIPVVSLISPRATVAKGVQFGCGVFVAHNACISVQAEIDDFSLVNSAAIIGHHVNVGVNTIISPNVFVGGYARIGNSVILGASSNILQGIDIADNSMVGMGANVFKSLPQKSVVWPSLNKITSAV